MAAHQILKARYVVDQPFCKGRLADVYEGVDVKTKTAVAVKLFHRGLPDELYLREAFNRESQRLMTLKHRSIISMLDYGTDGPEGRPFIVLEWGGVPIDKWLKGDCPYQDWNEFYEKVGCQLLEGIAYAHFRETAHRELKPADFLVDEAGRFRLADFGVSKFPEFIDIALDIGQFLKGNEPFSPSDGYDPAYSYTTDVWGYVTVCLHILTKGKLQKWTDIVPALNSLAAPAEVRAVLHDAVLSNAAERPENALLLLEQLNRATRKARPAQPKETCFLNLSDNALQKLRQQVSGLEGRYEAERFIENDLQSGGSLAKFWSWDPVTRTETLVPGQFSLIGESLKLIVAVETQFKASLNVISTLRPVSDGYLERERNQGWPTDLLFKVGKPYAVGESRKLIDSLLRGVEYHEEKLEERKRQDDEENLFRNWQDLLQLRIDHCREGKGYNYSGTESDGNRITFSLTETPDKSIIEEVWKVDKSSLVGVVDEVGDDSITLYIDEGDAKNPPPAGRLMVDRRAAERQLKVQLEALNIMRYPLTERQEVLKQRLLHPSDAETNPATAPVAKWFTANLDDNKKAVIQAALAAQDVFLAEGPPGTGKTTFIAELILQQLDRYPQKRILLTSQTHIAVDNAIERVARFRPDLRITRVGRQESKVAGSVHRYLLQNRLEEWRKRVYEQAFDFLKRKAEQGGVDVAEIQMSLDAGVLVKARRDLQLAVESEEERLQELGVIETQLSAKDAQQNPATDAHQATFLQSEKDRVTDDLIRLRKTVKDRAGILRLLRVSFQRVYPAHANWAEKSAEEIVEWQDKLIGSSPAANRFRALFELNAEWIQRFALREDCEEAILMDSDLIAGTCIGIAGSDAEGETYGLCILDEASKASFPEALVPLIRSEKWILVGDQRQLPPFMDVMLTNRQVLEDRGIDAAIVRETLLTRLSLRQIPEHARAMLYRQHRMVPAIGELVSQVFYEGKLQSVGENQIPDPVAKWIPKPVTWISTSKEANHAEQRVPSGSWMNPLEANWIRQLLRQLESFAALPSHKSEGSQPNEPIKVVVLSGYSAQRNHLENVLHSEACPHLDIQCHTVDAYQGREADVVIFSVTRSNSLGRPGFLSERERINVALSRAQFGLCVIGDADFCRSLGGRSALSEVRAYIEAHPDHCRLKEGLK